MVNVTSDIPGIPAFNVALPNGRQMLECAGLKFSPSRLLVIVGPNGAGKTSFARSLCGLGNDNVPVVGEAPTLVWQAAELFPGSVLKNISIVQRGEKGRALSSEAVSAAANYFGLTPKLGSSVNQLSGGEAQRVNVVRGFLAGRSGIVLDEPSSSLDQEGLFSLRRAITLYLKPELATMPGERWIGEVAGSRRYVVLISHDRSFIESLSNDNPRFACIDKNDVRVAADGRESVRLDTGPGLDGYSLEDVKRGAISLFWAQFFGAKNVFYVDELVRVESPRQLRQERRASRGFVVVPYTSASLADGEVVNSVECQVCEADAAADRVLVSFLNGRSERVAIWVHSAHHSRSPLGARLWLALAADLEVKRQIGSSG